ncbi:MAG: hypothetical protein HQM01_13790, partial [Magnetococcales bacterium]|nr:hypothetical protein [Magnetococcales bacterium]
MESTPPETEPLPGFLGEIAEVVGAEAAHTLMREYGGTRVFVPRKMRVMHKLATLLGIEQARKLSQHFAGETMNIPRGVALERQRRNAEIIRRYNAGVGVRQLARDNALTER